MKNKISNKLFGAIAAGFISLIIVLVFALNIYFSHFYEKAKIDNLVQAVNKFDEDNKNNNWSSDELYRQIELFSSKNNVTLSIADRENEEENNGDDREESGEESSEENHGDESLRYVLLTIIDNDKNYYDFFLTSEEFYALNLQEGNWINIQGFLGENEVVIPNAINSIPIESKVSDKENGIPLDFHVQIITIKENLKLPNRTIDSNFSVLDSGTKDNVSFIISEIPHTEIKQVELRKKVRINNNAKYLFVLASLQPINETISVLTSFYPFIFIFSLIASLIIAIIHSSWVSRPIVVINKAANKMANLEFDITLNESRSDELGQLSKSLNSMSKSLETSINELTQAKDQLQKDYDMEVRRQKAQKEFIANASHELKAPLGVIKGYAEGIKDGMGHGQLDEYVSAIVDESKKMNELILSMLQLSKFDLLGNKLNLEDVDFEVIIFDLIQSFEWMLSERQLLIDVTGEFEDIYCDMEMIKSAIQNLLGNAIKYADKNSTIKIRSIVKENVHRFEIENVCEPFNEDEKERIWEKFYKRDLSHNREVKGTGLGLAIVKGIFEAHQFEYGVYNTETGVCFWFEYII